MGKGLGLDRGLRKNARKPGRPPIDQRAANIVIQLATDYPMLPSATIKKMTDAEIEKRHRNRTLPISVKGPGQRKVDELVSKARDPNYDPLDGPWSMATLANESLRDYWPNNLAPETLLELLRDSIIMDRRFTIRQAIWATRLQDILSHKRPEWKYKGPDALYEWASIYGGRELAAKILNQTMDTTDLDAHLAFDAEVYEAIVETGVSPKWGLTEWLNDLKEGSPELHEHQLVRLFGTHENDSDTARIVKGIIRLMILESHGIIGVWRIPGWKAYLSSPANSLRSKPV